MSETSRFFDVKTGVEMQLRLRRHGDEFQILRKFGYRDPGYVEPFIVPADPEHFRTDLASIPWVFAWLVPGLGTHLPAVLLHDALVVNGGKDHEGPDIRREEADRIFRDAMQNLGTPKLRRWLMWTAVILATAWSALEPRWWWRTLVVVTFGSVVVLGTLATFDLLDVWALLPWMKERVWWVELIAGAAFALIIPLGFSVLWRRLWRAAAIGGVALAFLLHVTVAVILVFGIYWLAEKVVSRREGAGPSVKRNLARQAASVSAPDTR
jgi:hypothetical protein